MRTFAVKQLFSSAKIQYFFKIECENNIKKITYWNKSENNSLSLQKKIKYYGY